MDENTTEISVSSDRPDEVLNTSVEDPPEGELSGQGVDGGEKSVFGNKTDADWKDPTQAYSPASYAYLKFSDEEIQPSIDALKENRIAVVRSLDHRVLFALEHTLAAAITASFPGISLRSIDSRYTMRQLQGKNVDDPFPTIWELRDKRIGAGPLVIFAAAYSVQASSLLDTLPDNFAALNDLRQSLEKLDRYICVLSSPSQVKATGERKNLPIFKPAISFVRPLLEEAGHGALAVFLSEQYKAGLWSLEQYKAGSWSREPGDDAVDEEFYDRVRRDIDNGIIDKLIEAGQKVRAKPGKDMVASFLEAATEIRKVQRPGDWPPEDRFLEQAVLFVAGFFNGVTSADFERILKQLVADDLGRHCVPARSLQRAGNATEVHIFRDVRLSETWSLKRHALLRECGLRVATPQGEPTIHCQGVGGADLVKRALPDRYPFAYAELWNRALTLGLLFDPSVQVSQMWRDALLKRIESDPAGFGRTFLYEVLLSDAALKPFAGDFGDRFDALAETGRLSHVLARIKELLSGAIRSQQANVENALEQLIALRAPAAVLSLIRRLSNDSGFALDSRMKLVRRILRQGGKEHWENCCGLLAQWCLDNREGWVTIRKLVQSLPARRTTPTGPAVAEAGILIDLVGTWFAAARSGHHPFLELIEAAERNGTLPAEVFDSLLDWLFHPALEKACEERGPVGFSTYWLLARPLRESSTEERAQLAEMQRWALRALSADLARQMASSASPAQLRQSRAARECQAIVLADWAAALKTSTNGAVLRDLLIGAFAKHASKDTRRELHTMLHAIDEASVALRNQLTDRVREAPVLKDAIESLNWNRTAIRDLSDSLKAFEKPKFVTANS